MFVIVLNGSTYQRLRDLFPEVEWRSHRDYLMAEVDHRLAAEMEKVAREAGLSVGERVDARDCAKSSPRLRQ